MPADIRDKLKADPSYLEVLRAYQDSEYHPTERRYWCFPKYRTSGKIVNKSLYSEQDSTMLQSERSGKS